MLIVRLPPRNRWIRCCQIPRMPRYTSSDTAPGEDEEGIYSQGCAVATVCVHPPEAARGCGYGPGRRTSCSRQVQLTRAMSYKKPCLLARQVQGCPEAAAFGSAWGLSHAFRGRACCKSVNSGVGDPHWMSIRLLHWLPSQLEAGLPLFRGPLAGDPVQLASRWIFTAGWLELARVVCTQGTLVSAPLGGVPLD